jgi:sulfite exporter TauE/SafE/copper chaperone CopZ
MIDNKKIYIKGMTCVSCEILITDELNQIKEVDTVTVCRKKKTAEVSYNDSKLKVDDIIEKIKKIGYSASLDPDDLESAPKASIWQWVLALWVVVCLYAIYKLLGYFGLLDWVNVDPSNINYGMAFLIGIVASLSTCLAIVGAVVISFSAKYKGQGNFYSANVKPHILFHLGRLTAFAILGGLLGLVGSWFELSLGWMGLNILGVLPSLTAIGIRMPGKSMNTWGRLKKSEHALAPVLLGAFTFFLPCGFTQSMQLFAVSSGSFFVGALTMFLFALGTVPVLAGLGMATSRFKNTKTVVFQKVIGFLVILFAFYTLLSGLAIAGVNIGLIGGGNVGNAAQSGNFQVVEMTVTYSGYNPNVFKIKRGVPVKWIITGEQITGCTNEVMIPSLGIRQSIFRGENIIEFTPNKVGTLGFSCWMGMVRGKFIVEDDGEIKGVSDSNPDTYQDPSLNSSCGAGGGGCGCSG